MTNSKSSVLYNNNKPTWRLWVSSIDTTSEIPSPSRHDENYLEFHSSKILKNSIVKRKNFRWLSWSFQEMFIGKHYYQAQTCVRAIFQIFFRLFSALRMTYLPSSCRLSKVGHNKAFWAFHLKILLHNFSRLEEFLKSKLGLQQQALWRRRGVKQFRIRSQNFMFKNENKCKEED